MTTVESPKKVHPFYPFKKVWGFILANALLSLVIVLAFMGSPFRSLEVFAISFAWSFAICVTQWLGHGFIFHYLDTKISWIKTPVKRAISGLVALVIYSAIAFWIIQSVFFYLVNGHSPQVSWLWVLGNVLFPVGISFVITLSFTTIGFFRAWKTSFVKAEKLNTEMMTYKYEVLRNQINPHFLFNSFNVLTDLVYEDQDAAAKFIQQLSHLFRYVLDNRQCELVPLEDEVSFVRSFSYLLTTRFENKLEIIIDVQTSEGEWIVPVSLQMIIENAVKHNEVSESFPLKIKICKNNNFLEITNTLKEKKVDDGVAKTGLQNLQQQFAFFTEEKIEIKKSDKYFKVRLPILKLEMGKV